MVKSDQESFRFLPAIQFAQPIGDNKKATVATAPGLRFTFSANPPDNVKFRKARRWEL